MSELDDLREELSDCLRACEALDLVIVRLQRKMAELQQPVKPSLEDFLRPSEHADEA
jgi:hypothetical protein